MVINKSKRSKEMIVSVMERSKKVGKLIKQKCLKVDVKNAIPLAVLVLVLASQQDAFAADGALEMDSQIQKVMDLVFSSWIKKICLILGFGMGGFQAYATQTAKPFLVCSGIGLMAGFAPNVIDLIVKV